MRLIGVEVKWDNQQAILIAFGVKDFDRIGRMAAVSVKFDHMSAAHKFGGRYSPFGVVVHHTTDRT
ncbi:hypothetical protein BST30_11185 [Mycobacterium mantenii]|uniref:Uncharacterized protein n=1 Tax=Mycobacterium mantenii TaxID=560555 RepID=A0A1X0FXH3_MYCNT|nr:hypothetical protein BST30_11185 [Mycobacterium mantenii]